jgi:hypothetical protein
MAEFFGVGRGSSEFKSASEELGVHGNVLVTASMARILLLVAGQSGRVSSSAFQQILRLGPFEGISFELVVVIDVG